VAAQTHHPPHALHLLRREAVRIGGGNGDLGLDPRCRISKITSQDGRDKPGTDQTAFHGEHSSSTPQLPAERAGAGILLYPLNQREPNCRRKIRLHFGKNRVLFLYPTG